MQRYSKSRTFAVIQEIGSGLNISFLWRKTSEPSVKELVVTRAVMPHSGYETKDQIINLLVKSGATVRYFDREESQWMDVSDQLGMLRAPGPRDGQWAVPTLEDFEESYLTTQ